MTNLTNHYQQAYQREKKARKEAENILEAKSLELYYANEKLTHLNNNLEKELEKRLEEIKLAEQEFKSFVEKAKDIVYRLDTLGNFTYINPIGLEIFEHSNKELLGKNFTELVHPSYVKKVATLFLKQMTQEIDSMYYEHKIVSKSGKEIWLGQNVQLLKKENTTEIISVARNITERKELEQVILESENKYRGILENLDFGLLELDLNGKITKVYPSFTTLTNYTTEDLIGKSTFDFLHPHYQSKVKALEKKRKPNHTDVFEVKIKKKDNSYIWVLINGAPYYNTRGKQKGSVTIFLDITERKIMEEDLRKANQFALASSKSKELFLANMSHEIRTPLNAVIGLSNLLKKTKLDYEQENYISNISKSANSLLLLVNDILDISKIESGKLEISKAPFLLQELLDKIQASVNYEAEQKNLRLFLSVDNSLDDYYITDELRLTQILINLTNNAIKFTDSGWVKIELELIKQETDTHFVKISVSDTGKGISPSRLEKIFHDFEQENANIANQYGGTGLGLSISKKLVKLLGGTLKVKSTIGKGSEFYFNLPLKKVHKLQQEIKHIPVNTQINWSKIRFLIAEDNPVNQLVIESTLQKWGATTDTVENGQLAIEKLQQNTYDIVLMDMQMPIMDGLETSKHIRRNLKLNIPIIALTANALKKDLDKCIKAGMNAYISKPFKEDDLKNLLLQFIENPTEETQTKENPKQLTIESLEDIARGNPNFIIKMLSIFIETGEQELAKLKNNESIEEISKIAHKIKPSIDHLADTTLQKLVREIEAKKFVTAPELLEEFIYLFELILLESKELLNKQFPKTGIQV